MSTKVSKLTQSNIKALRDVGAEEQGVQIAETYVVFPQTPPDALAWLQHEMEELSNRTAHPYASLHAVVRKLSAQVVAGATPTTPPTSADGPDPDEFHPDIGENFQILKGYGRDDDTFRVIEYAPVTSAPERLQSLYNLPQMPTEEVHCWRLERVPAKTGKDMVMMGVAFNAFPTAIMVPVGTIRAAGVLADGTPRPQRVRASSSRPSSGACEHCGAPTKGGRFVPGHDAKLKGELIRAAQSEDPDVRIPALAESAIRAKDSAKWAINPSDEDAASVDAIVLADSAGFLTSRNVARSDDHQKEG